MTFFWHLLTGVENNFLVTMKHFLKGPPIYTRQELYIFFKKFFYLDFITFLKWSKCQRQPGPSEAKYWFTDDNKYPVSLSSCRNRTPQICDRYLFVWFLSSSFHFNWHLDVISAIKELTRTRIWIDSMTLSTSWKKKSKKLDWKGLWIFWRVISQ